MKPIDLTICNVPWQIRFCDSIEIDETDGKHTIGLCDNANRVIAISRKDERGNNMSQKEIDITTIHELIHAILFEGGYEHDDEELVELLATNLYNVKQTLGG